jgi:hypothetical protein
MCSTTTPDFLAFFFIKHGNSNSSVSVKKCNPITIINMMSPMHKKVIAAGSLFSELAHALRRSIREASSNPFSASMEQDQPPENQLHQPVAAAASVEAESDSDELDTNPPSTKDLSKDVASGLSDDVMLKITAKKVDPPTVNKSIPDIHPELTLHQLQNPPSSSSSRFRRSNDPECNLDDNPVLEINNMFDFHSTRPSRTRPIPGRDRQMTSTASAGTGRRSSVAVMAGGAIQQRSELQKRTRHYFESHHLNLDSSKQLQTIQSSSAVHYLAISPPRIRITDDTGSVSPDMYGRRHGQGLSNIDLASAQVVLSEVDDVGQLVSIKKTATAVAASLAEQDETSLSCTSSSSTTSSTNSSSWSRGTSVESRRSSAGGFDSSVSSVTRSCYSTRSSISNETSARSSFDVADSSRRSSEDLLGGIQQNKEAPPIMSPISENSFDRADDMLTPKASAPPAAAASAVIAVSNCSISAVPPPPEAMKERRASLNLPFNSRTEILEVLKKRKSNPAVSSLSPIFRVKQSPSRKSPLVLTSTSTTSASSRNRSPRVIKTTRRCQFEKTHSSISLEYPEQVNEPR